MEAGPGPAEIPTKIEPNRRLTGWVGLPIRSSILLVSPLAKGTRHARQSLSVGSRSGLHHGRHKRLGERLWTDPGRDLHLQRQLLDQRYLLVASAMLALLVMSNLK